MNVNGLVAPSYIDKKLAEYSIIINDGRLRPVISSKTPEKFDFNQDGAPSLTTCAIRSLWDEIFPNS